MFLFFLSFCFSKTVISSQQEKSFVSWMRTNNVYYNGEEYHFRLGVYLSNMRYIEEFNKGKHSFFLRSNKFTTWTSSEYRSILGNLNSVKPGEVRQISPFRKAPTNDDIPENFDLRDQNVVSEIRDQGSCGGCWAFACCAAQETNWALKKGADSLYVLSPQNLIDCVWDCLGCNGGKHSWALSYVSWTQSGKFMLEKDYQYRGATGDKCLFDESKGVTHLRTYYFTSSGDDDDLVRSIYTNGAHAVTMDALSSPFKWYGGGIYTDDKCTTWWENHCMAAVGYGVDNGTPYYLIKNSWGLHWGEKGYLRIIRGNNTCGISSSALYPYEYDD